MTFTDEMITEDENRWHARNVITELEYCSRYMQDRKDISKLDIRFYAYLMREARKLLTQYMPRVLTLDEVKSRWSRTKQNEFYVERRDREEIEIYSAGWMLAHFTMLLSTNSWVNGQMYNKYWRCWSVRPTDEQREATPWME